MVKKSTIRTFCMMVGVLFIVVVISSHSSTVPAIVGIGLSIILIIFGFVITSPWVKYIIGEHQEGTIEEKNRGFIG
jgi:multisubunit Na+/H+ antiporter MnhG subunit